MTEIRSPRAFASTNVRAAAVALGSEPPPIDMERAIAALPDGARHVLVLVGIYGFSHAEAAATLGVSEASSKTQLHRARGLLTSALGLGLETA